MTGPDTTNVDAPTCGKGLAEHAALPARMAEILVALADNLALHMPALDLTDASARKEYDAYERLEKAYRSIGTRLQVTAQQMGGYRDLPMGRHDETALSDPRIVEVFSRYVKLEEELLTQLQRSVEADRTMLASFRDGG